MSHKLDRITINGFKSIKELVDFEFRNLNVIIGANGSGKSNLISFFKMLRALMENNLNKYISDNGGAGDILFNGRKITERMEFEMHFDVHRYRFSLVPTAKDTISIENEAIYYSLGSTKWLELGNSQDAKAKMVDEVLNKHLDSDYSRPVYEAISSWQIYHFHDTSSNAGMRHYEIIQDDKILRKNASNIAPFLMKLKNKYEVEYQNILNAVKLVTPFFEDFLLEPRTNGLKESVNLSWHQKGSDYPMQPYHLSDGTIRFICLATALLQPNPPSAIIIDEPELGLHPAAIEILSELIKSASERTQVIVATQSPALIDQFAIDDIIVVNRVNGASTFKRLNENDFSEWLDEYSVGELWTKSVIAGGPEYE
jgi:predicted ATPase